MNFKSRILIKAYRLLPTRRLVQLLVVVLTLRDLMGSMLNWSVKQTVMKWKWVNVWACFGMKFGNRANDQTNESKKLPKLA